MTEQIGFGYSPKTEEVVAHVPLSQKTVELKIFEPKIGDEAARVYANGILCFIGKVTRIIPRGANEPVYRLENEKKQYELAYGSEIVRVCDIPPQPTPIKLNTSLFDR